ncbi:MAG: YceI family protein, partial [Alphaproteobacteria bacterium]
MKLSRISGLVTGLYVILFALFLNAPAFAAETYNLDKGHTDIRFGWNHAGVSDQSGRFNDFEGQLILNEEDPTKSSLNVTIKTNSLSTGVERLDAHLKNADFFEVTKFPNITFTSKRIVRTGKSLASVIGDLTIRGVTKPVTLDVELMHKGKHPLGQFIEYYKGEWLGFKGWIPVRSATLSSKPD